ncbi:hypothetical protein NXS19_014039 [Fusarium pseudograminearum]|nr:hypothetical protein NXS19_014039 [Fusarium pseudograminearum]
MSCPDYQAQPTHGGLNGIASFNVVFGLGSIRCFGVMLSQGKSTKRSSPLPSRIPQHDDSIMCESTANSRLGELNPARSTSKSSRLILSVSNIKNGIARLALATCYGLVVQGD